MLQRDMNLCRSCPEGFVQVRRRYRNKQMRVSLPRDNQAYHLRRIDASRELIILTLSSPSPPHSSSPSCITSSIAPTLAVFNCTMQSVCFWKNRATSTTFGIARPVPRITTVPASSSPTPSPLPLPLPLTMPPLFFAEEVALR